VIFDPKKTWVFDEKSNLSKSHCSPFLGQTLKGTVLSTYRSGHLQWSKA